MKSKYFTCNLEIYLNFDSYSDGNRKQETVRYAAGLYAPVDFRYSSQVRASSSYQSRPKRSTSGSRRN